MATGSIHECIFTAAMIIIAVLMIHMENGDGAVRTTGRPLPLRPPLTIPKSVKRLNYGVKFEYRAAAIPVTDIWYHSFTIPIPAETWLTIGAERKQRFAEACAGNATNKLKPKCNIFTENWQLIGRIQDQSYTTLQELAYAIASMIPQEPGRVGRARKALLPFVGTIFKGLFGVPTTNDLEVLNSHLASVAQLQTDQLKIFKTSNEHMNSFIKLSNERMESLAEAVRNSSIENIRMMEVAVSDVKATIQYLNKMSLFAEETQFAFAQLERQYIKLLDALEVLVGGHLPPYLIREGALKAALLQIQQELDAANSGLRIIHMSSGWYYSSASYIYTARQNMLIVTVQVPLTSMATEFYIYEIKTYPLVLEKDKTHIMVLEEMPNAVAISRNQEFYYTLDNNDMQEINMHHYSKIQRIYLLTAVPSCVMSVFRDIKHLVDKTCIYSIVKNALETGIHHLEKATYFMINVESYKITCDNGQNTTVQTGCASCVVQLRAGCTWSSGKWFVPKTLVENVNRSEGLLHTTNLGLMLKYFDPNTTLEKARVKGDTLFHTQPIMELPPFRFYEEKVQQRYVGEEKQKLNLDKAVMIAKNDQVILGSLSQAIVTGVVQEWFDFFQTVPGVVLALTTIITILTTINGIYLSFRCRQILVTLAVLKEHVLTVKGEEMVLTLDYYKQGVETAVKSLTESNRTVTSDIHKIILEATTNIWPQVLATFLGLILLVIVIHSIYKKRNPNYLSQACTQLLLELEGEKETEFVHLETVRGQAEDLCVTADEYIKDVEVVGDIWPYITFNWSSMKVTNSVTGQILGLKNKYAISWKVAMVIRRILKTKYVCLPVYVNCHRLQRVYVQSTADISNAISRSVTGRRSTRKPPSAPPAMEKESSVVIQEIEDEYY